MNHSSPLARCHHYQPKRMRHTWCNEHRQTQRRQRKQEATLHAAKGLMRLTVAAQIPGTNDLLRTD